MTRTRIISLRGYLLVGCLLAVIFLPSMSFCQNTGFGSTHELTGSSSRLPFDLRNWLMMLSRQDLDDENLFRQTTDAYRQFSPEGTFETPSFFYPLASHDSNPDIFSRHIKEAIALNRERREIYSKLSKGKSELISKELITMEYAIIPLARICDKWGRKFQKQGIPIITNDFVSMSLVKPFDAPLKFKGKPSKNIKAKAKSILMKYSRAVRVAIFRKDFRKTADFTAKAINEIRRLEDEENCHLAMTCHMLESIGLVARNALKYRIQSHGRTDHLAQVMLASNLLGLYPFARLDFLANPLHEQGIGILVNDLPPIPFP